VREARQPLIAAKGDNTQNYAQRRDASLSTVGSEGSARLKPPVLGFISNSRWIVLAFKPIASVMRLARRHEVQSLAAVRKKECGGNRAVWSLLYGGLSIAGDGVMLSSRQAAA
jgi:hypothetical protein